MRAPSAVLFLILATACTGRRQKNAERDTHSDPPAQSFAELSEEAPKGIRRRGPMAVLATLLLLADPAAAFFWTKATEEKEASKKTPGAWKKRLSFIDRMLAGSGARGTAQILLHPIDVMRTRLQAKGIQSALTPETFLKGLTPQATLSIPAGALQFGAYEWAKAMFSKLKMTGALPELLSGAIGAVGASIVITPREVLKQRIQANVYPNIVSGLKTLMRTEGIKGLYKGYLAQLLRDVPYHALSFMFFSQAKEYFKKWAGRPADTQENLALGAVTGMIAAIIMTPVDVVKTRLMTGGAEGGIMKTFAAIIEKEGLGALMKGVVPRVCYLAPFAAMSLSLYELYGKKIVSAKTGVPFNELEELQ